MDSLDLTLALRHEASRARWWKELHRNDAPPFLGPLVSVREAAQTLQKSDSFVRARLRDGRLNFWKDPASRRIWILQDDLDILIADLNARQQHSESRRGARPKRKKDPEPDEPEEYEDLDAIDGWVAPEPRGAAGYLEDHEKEREARYQQKERETEEWYATELAKLEGRDPEAAVRQLRIERGWMQPEPTRESDSVPAPVSPLPLRRGEGQGVRGAVRPVSWSDPNAKPHAKPEPSVDPDDQSAIRNPQSAIERPFPMGWITARVAQKILDVNHTGICRLVSEGKLRRRKRETERAIWLYDSVEVEELANARLAKSNGKTPGRNLNWWSPRNEPIDLSEFDAWMTLEEAAQVLDITPGSVGALCDRGLLPARQKEPGKRGSRVYVPHHHVLRLKERPEYQKRRAAKSNIQHPKPTSEVDPWETGWPFEPFGKNLDVDHGEFYSQAQTAKVLCVTVQAVHQLRVRGRLEGHRISRDRKGRSGQFKWWFYLKADVDALRADPAYADHHRRWVKTRNVKAGWGDEDE